MVNLLSSHCVITCFFTFIPWSQDSSRLAAPFSSQNILLFHSTICKFKFQILTLRRGIDSPSPRHRQQLSKHGMWNVELASSFYISLQESGSCLLPRHCLLQVRRAGCHAGCPLIAQSTIHLGNYLLLSQVFSNFGQYFSMSTDIFRNWKPK